MHELFREFITLAQEVLRITKMLEMPVSENDDNAAEAAIVGYAKLYEKRAPMFVKLNKLVELIDFEQLDDTQKQCARETLNAVMEADTELAELARQLNLSMRGEMQGIDSAKKLTTGYTHPVELEAQVGGSFDTKQ